MHVSGLWLTVLAGVIHALAVSDLTGQLKHTVPQTSPVHHLRSSITNATDDIVARKTPKHHCENIHEAKDMCKHARKYCSPQSAGIVDYIAWYYCDMKEAQPLAFSVLVLWAALLFSTIGIASSDFFCPNLATVSNSLGLSQSVAGVTFLAFGNGSPDVFSTFAAFKAHSGSLAIGELLGAAAFITSVVAGCMAIIAPFKVSRRSFLRDAGFFLVAVILTMVLLADGTLHLWESILMIVFYTVYVAYVLIGTYVNRSDNKKKIMESRIRSQYTPIGQEVSATLDDDMDESTQRLLGENHQDISALEAGGHDSDEDKPGEHEYQDLNSSMSVTGRPTHTLSNTVRPSLIGALEFRELVSGFGDDGSLSPSEFRLIRKRSRAHSAACHTPVISKREIGRTHSGNVVKAVKHRTPDVNVHDSRRSRSQSFTQRPWQTDGIRGLTLDRSGRLPIDMSRSSSASENALPTDEIASASLRKHNPIELLSPNVFLTPELQPIPVIKIDEPGEETDPFALDIAIRDASSDSPKMPTYETMNETTNTSSRPIRPTVVIPESIHESNIDKDNDHEEFEDENENEEDTPNEINCNCQPAWCPAWWPVRLLPVPRQLRSLLFPTLCDFRSQSYTQRLLSILAVPSIFVLTITLPVVNPPIDQKVAELNENGRDLEAVIAKDDAERYTAHRGWNRWLTSVQCILAPLFILLAVLAGEYPLLYSIPVALLIGLFLLTINLFFTSADVRPRFHTWFSFIGFAVSVCWISTIANEVVGTLQAFGTILGLSDAILGLTVFAVGNSLGDFVADITVARMGFSQMAISGVFGGPMLNILLGIGLSGVYITTSKHQVYNTEISTTLIASGASLLITLIVLLVAVPANNYVMSRKLGFVLCGIFFTGMVISVLVEIYLQ